MKRWAVTSVWTCQVGAPPASSALTGEADTVMAAAYAAHAARRCAPRQKRARLTLAALVMAVNQGSSRTLRNSTGTIAPVLRMVYFSRHAVRSCERDANTPDLPGDVILAELESRAPTGRRARSAGRLSTESG